MKKERKSKHFINKPMYPGGVKALQAFIKQHLKYPQEALDGKVEGTVFVRYTIDHKGQVTDTKVLTGLGHGCDEEAQRVVSLLRFKVPKNRGVRAIFHKDIYVHFRLPQSNVTANDVQYNIIPTPSEKKATPPKTDTDSGYTITIEW